MNSDMALAGAPGGISPRHSTTAPELLAPAGNWDCARAAVANGADAIYFGAPAFNARMRADNFSKEDLPRLVRFLHAKGVRAYTTLNVLIFENELQAASQLLDLLHSTGIDAVIMQDVGLARLAAQAGVPVHASTQMTITSPEGVAFAKDLGARRVVLARETSLRELARFAPPNTDEGLPLETFVHGALCVAYSGQCLTSEALGQRSANRGECAQACRMPYQLIVDGERIDLGDKRYLLSPQDLAAVSEIPEIIRLGVRSFKIEGRLKTPEYVAAVCRVYRKAIDDALAQRGHGPSAKGRYELEMSFSRGLYSGWMHGVNHQELVHARFGKKRGALIGQVKTIARNSVTLDRFEATVRTGDGVVFDEGRDTENEIGGRVYAVKGLTLEFDPERVDPRRIAAGTRVWKTDDPALDKELRAEFANIKIDDRISLRITATFDPQSHLLVAGIAADGRSATVRSATAAQPAVRHPLTLAVIQEQLGRLGSTSFRADQIGFVPPNGEGLMLPLSELGRLRHALVAALTDATPKPQEEERVVRLLSEKPRSGARTKIVRNPPTPTFSALCRTTAQLEAAVELGLDVIHLDFEDVRRCGPAIAAIRSRLSGTQVFVASPRIIKAGEGGFLGMVEKSGADGFLVRNAAAIARLRETGLPLAGDFSLNIANSLSAALFEEKGIAWGTPSFDLNADQLCDLIGAFKADWFEIVIHQHIPMFHMEHCVFAAFLSNGTDHTNCGRPCERHRVTLRDRVGQEHPLSADVGCRNTLFNGRAQSGAAVLDRLRCLGVSRFRIDLLDETAAQTVELVTAYKALARGEIDPDELFQTVRAVRQLGVTGGTLTVLDHS